MIKPSKLHHVPITNSVAWVGVQDFELRVFDIIMKADFGSTYNSYLVRGAEKVALIETAKITFYDEFRSRIKSIIDPSQIDYIILNHLEPDHSGSLARFLAEEAPNAQVVISRFAPKFLRNIVNQDLNPMTVGDGDSIDLGGKTLRFISAQFLHWPDTMFTYLEEEGVLFSCDTFGCHHACGDSIFNEHPERFWVDFRYYFDHIIRPFKDRYLKAHEKIKDLDIKVICPSHGPVLANEPRRYIDTYYNWSQCQLEKKAVIAYVSAYGNTKLMAETISQTLNKRGVATILYDLCQALPEDFLDQIETASALIVGSPTINGDALRPVWDFLGSLATVKLKGKVGASFGSCGWSGEAVGQLSERLRSLKIKTPVGGLKCYLVPNPEELAACRSLGDSMATAIEGVMAKQG